MFTLDLFAAQPRSTGERRQLGPGAWLLEGFAFEQAAELLAAIEAVQAESPFRHLVTPGGFTMSVAMTNCGRLGWASDLSGYRYSALDPLTQAPWPPLPEVFAALAASAATAAGYPPFEPDACLINAYVPGARLSLHQDKDEQDLAAPIVSVSLGLPAVFLFGGRKRNDPVTRYHLQHGDVVVWGGEDRLRFHGVSPVKDGEHPLVGRKRLNLTFRKVTA
ncbi:DNA oxidative demethylase AlkB [Pseudomonas sp. DC3000-4b1]|uniref:DNA oxidative demethylase AlkB n=1 Tax=unclassified Pseudomonas TaxID=196821 RepID=UPI003CF6F32F